MSSGCCLIPSSHQEGSFPPRTSKLRVCISYSHLVQVYSTAHHFNFTIVLILFYLHIHVAHGTSVLKWMFWKSKAFHTTSTLVYIYFTFVVFNAAFTFFIASSKFSSSSGVPLSFFKIPYWRKKPHITTSQITSFLSHQQSRSVLYVSEA